MIKRAMVAALLAANSIAIAPAQATSIQDAASVEEAEIVIVGMSGKPYRLDSDRLRDAVNTFEKHRERYAPEATLDWRIDDYDPSDDVELTLVERRSGERFAVTIAPDGSFTLPHDRLLDTKHDLSANRLSKSLRIRPMLFSPGGTEERHRLGDSRLWCRVMLAFADNDMGIGAKLLLGAVGGCKSSRVTFLRSTDRPIESAILSGHDEALDVAEDRMSYRMPVHLRDVGNDEIITITLADEAFAVEEALEQ